MPGRRAARRNSSAANPSPPAAPAPGSSRLRAPRASSVTSAHRPSAASRTLTSAGDAPFCGPYTAAAPCGPSSGLSTSEATRNSISPKRRSPVRSAFARRASAAPPGGSSRPASSSSRAPIAWARPAPPSLVATPPSPSTIRRAPARAAARISSPAPRLVAVSGASFPPFRSCASPQACAASITAVPPRRAKEAVTRCPATGPVTSTTIRSNPAATAASTVPSPPSATGSSTVAVPGEAARSPAAIRAAASAAVSDPLNLSGAMTT